MFNAFMSQVTTTKLEVMSCVPKDKELRRSKKVNL